MRVEIDGETTLAAAVALKGAENQRGCCCTSRQALRCQPAANADGDRWRNNSDCGSRSQSSENQCGCCCTSRQVAWCQPAVNAGRDRWRNNSGCGSRGQKFGEPAWLLLHIAPSCVVPTSSKCGSVSMDQKLWLRQSLSKVRRT